MRLTVIGSGTSEPQPETPASGILVETGTFGLLVDCGQGVVRELLRIRDPRELDAIVVGHMHADHYIGLISLRYLLPWNGTSERLVVYLPPDGRARIRELASAISERPEFFEDAFSIIEYDPDERLAVGDMTISFIPGQHYIPAWGFSISDTDGHRVVISGDTGPNDGLVEVARGSDALVIEATLASPADDDPQRGHLTSDEALAVATRAGVPKTILVHYPAELRDRIDKACARVPGAIAGQSGMIVEIEPLTAAPAPTSRPATAAVPVRGGEPTAARPIR
jgi:ribonuclease BN (tRNA processing enzyme)